jgi:cytochrome c553
MACGFCHLPGGGGRPENAAIAGLPADYIVAQVTAFANGTRSAVRPDWRPTALMVQTARHTSVKDAAQAAAYFSSLPYVSHVMVEETATIATPRASGVLLMPGDSAAREPLGQRIAEGPVALEPFEWRDPDAAIIAWVPVGSIARGAELARGSDDRPACDSCHGEDLRGDVGPPLAGRFPSYLFRQLAAFRTGTRATPEAEAMRTISARLTNADMIALAAYAGSLKP